MNWKPHSPTLMNKQKLLAKALAGSKNLRFIEAVTLVNAFGIVWRGRKEAIIFPFIPK